VVLLYAPKHTRHLNLNRLVVQLQLLVELLGILQFSLITLLRGSQLLEVERILELFLPSNELCVFDLEHDQLLLLF